jgi:hypothetical protein
MRASTTYVHLVGVRNAQAGAITFVQRFGGLLNLNVHYHLIVPDGVFVAHEDTGELSVLRLPGPSDDVLDAPGRDDPRIVEQLVAALAAPQDTPAHTRARLATS